MAQSDKKRDTKDNSLLSLMRSAEDMDKQGIPPRSSLIREDVINCKKKGLTIMRRDLVL